MTSNIGTAVGGSYAASLGAANRLGGELNIPELLMAIQMERGNILDGQIRDQMADMQKRNEWLRDANGALAALRAARPGSEGGRVSYQDIKFTNSAGQQANALEWARQNGIDVGMDWPAIKECEDAKAALAGSLANFQTDWRGLGNYPQITDRNGNRINTDVFGHQRGYSFDPNTDDLGFRREFQSLHDAVANDLRNGVGSLSQSKVDAAIQNMKSSIDTVNNQSQMDMVRLQGLMDKRNQAFDLMSNTISKTGKSLDGIIGSMR